MLGKIVLFTFLNAPTVVTVCFGGFFLLDLLYTIFECIYCVYKLFVYPWCSIAMFPSLMSR